MWILFIIFVCFLLTIGYFISGNALAFTVKSLVGLGAIVFIGIVSLVIWSLNPPTKPSSLKPSSFTAQQEQTDPFPFYSADQQYAWYDRHDVPMSNRCYTTMTTPCSDLEWQRALGVSLTPQEEYLIKEKWCQQFAADWNWTMEQCLKN